MRHETLVNVFPSEDNNKRLVIAIEHPEAGRRRLVLRQETRSEAVGWFVQSCIEVLPEQVAGLKASLSGRLVSQTSAAPATPDPRRDIVSFSEAVAGRAG
jgi:hypothetical protein